MEFSANILKENFKVFSAALDVLSSLNEVVSLDVRNQQLLMSALNSSRTGQGIVHLSREFFDSYKLLRNDSPNTAIRCTANNKNLNNIIKKNMSSIDSIKMCEIRITEGQVEGQLHSESRIYMKLIYNNGVTKKYGNWYHEGDSIVPLYSLSNTCSYIEVEQQSLAPYIHRFHPKILDVEIVLKPSGISIRSYWEKTGGAERPLESSIDIKAPDMYEYKASKFMSVVFSIKEFKGILEFQAAMDAQVKAHIDDPGKPIVFKYEHGNSIILNVALMTHENTNDNDTVPSNNNNNATADEYSFTSMNSTDVHLINN